VPSACENIQSTYERDIVKRLHYYITVTDHVSLYNHNNEFPVEN
jgi:hypothetical protein